MKETDIKSPNQVTSEDYSPNIPLRAEEMDYNLLNDILKCKVYYLDSKILADRIKSDNIELRGTRGIGKTTRILAAFNILAEEDIFPAGVYFDIFTGDIKAFDPRIYLSEENREKWEWTLKADLTDPKKLINEAEVVCIDNWDYVGDLVAREATRDIGKAVMNELALIALEQRDEGKRIIISTKNPIYEYNRYIESENLEEISGLEDISGLPICVEPPLSSCLFSVYRVKADRKIEYMWEKHSNNLPRSFVNMLNKFGKKTREGIEIKWDYVINRDDIFNEINSVVRDENLSGIILENPKTFPPQILKIWLKKYSIKGVEDCEEKLKKISESISIMKNRVEEIKKYKSEIRECKALACEEQILKKLYEVLSSPLYQGLNGNTLDERINILERVYDPDGRLIMLESKINDFLKEILDWGHYKDLFSRKN